MYFDDLLFSAGNQTLQGGGALAQGACYAFRPAGDKAGGGHGLAVLQGEGCTPSAAQTYVGAAGNHGQGNREESGGVQRFIRRIKLLVETEVLPVLLFLCLFFRGQGFVRNMFLPHIRDPYKQDIRKSFKKQEQYRNE